VPNWARVPAGMLCELVRGPRARGKWADAVLSRSWRVRSSRCVVGRPSLFCERRDATGGGPERTIPRTRSERPRRRRVPFPPSPPRVIAGALVSAKVLQPTIAYGQGANAEPPTRTVTSATASQTINPPHQSSASTKLPVAGSRHVRTPACAPGESRHRSRRRAAIPDRAYFRPLRGSAARADCMATYGSPAYSGCCHWLG
jgi:hypothetical protein